MGLISDSEMAALREMTQSAMETPATLLALTSVSTANGWQDTWPTSGPTIYGMLYSEPQPLINETSGIMGIVDQLKFRVPVGTAIKSGDRLVIDDLTYTVQDADPDSTYLPWLRISLRRLS